MSGATLITAGIISTKIGSTSADSATLSVIGTLMMAAGAILMSINIIFRLIRNKSANADDKQHNRSDPS